jgi:hypothetical protein
MIPKPQRVPQTPPDDEATTNALVDRFWNPTKQVYELKPGLETIDRDDVIDFIDTVRQILYQRQ